VPYQAAIANTDSSVATVSVARNLIAANEAKIPAFTVSTCLPVVALNLLYILTICQNQSSPIIKVENMRLELMTSSVQAKRSSHLS
tara:strand:- start:1248 stop:1505 length:258 start_codon:yes stop_codon:yes gene_type:complete